MEAGVATVEKLGAMTPEQLEEIPGIGDEMVEKIQDAVVSYYGQFESGAARQKQRAAEAGCGCGAAAAADSRARKHRRSESVTIEIAESPAGAEAPDKEQGLI